MIGRGHIRESAAMALDTVWVNKLRSGLTILGVMVGVVTVMFMVSVIQGLNRSFAAQLEAIGSNIIYSVKFDPSFGRNPTQEERMRADFTIEDAEVMRSEMHNILGVSPIQRTISETVRFSEKQTDTPVLVGATRYYEDVHSQYVGSGRFLTDLDMQDRTDALLARISEDFRIDARTERQRQKLAFRIEIAAPQPRQILRISRLGPAPARIGEYRPNARILKRANAGVAVLGRMADLGDVDNAGRARVDEAERGGKHARVNLVRPIGGRQVILDVAIVIRFHNSVGKQAA